MRNSDKTRARTVLTILAMLMLVSGITVAQEKEEKSSRARMSEDVDRQAKHLFDKAIELMEYKQYERGLAMLNTVVRDNQGTILAHRANMAMGKHFLDQGKPKDALNYFMLLTRVLAPEPGEKQTEETRKTILSRTSQIDDIERSSLGFFASTMAVRSL